MDLFSKRAFGYTFGIALSMLSAIALAVIAARGTLTPTSVLLSILISLGASVAFAALIAGYKLPLRWTTWAYRAAMRAVAKRAIRSSLSRAMTRVKCLGIMEREGVVAIRIGLGESDNVKLDAWFNLYDSVNCQLWGRVEVVEVSELTSLCVPFDIINEDFWEHLEKRMQFDTSPPNVYLVRDVPSSEIMDKVVELLDSWR